MHCFHNRPMALACMLLALASVFAYAMPSPVKLFLCIAFGAAAVAFAILFLFRKGSRRSLLACLCLGAIALAFGSSYSYFGKRYEACRGLVGNEITAEGVVLSREDSAVFYSTLEVSIDRIDGEASRVKAEIYFDHSTPLQAGDRFLLTGEVIDPKTLLPERNAEKSFLAEGKLLYLSVAGGDGVEILSSDKTDFRVLYSENEEEFDEEFDEYVDDAEFDDEYPDDDE